MKRRFFLLPWLAVFALGAFAPAAPLVYERFENATVGTVHGGVSFAKDVVGCGGIAAPNQCAAALDGAPETGISYPAANKVTSTDFTVEAFIKLTDTAAYQAIAADWSEDGNDRSWAFVVTPGRGLRFDVSPDGGFHVGNKLETPARLLRPGQWYHVAAVSQGNTSRIYVNGRELAAAARSAPGIFRGSETQLKVGNVDRYATQGPRPFNGLLDEVRITPQALSPAEFITTKEPMPLVAIPGVPQKYELPFTATSREAAVAWQERARKRMMELVAAQQPRHSTAEVPLDVQMGTATDMGAYTLHKISFQGNAKTGVRYSCLLSIPKGKGPFPAMLALHGHGGSADDVFNPKSIYGGFADRFARGGYVVLAPSFPHRDYAAMTLWDLFRAVDVLCGLPAVDPRRIGVGGLSMGGEWTMWIAACDPRLGVAVVSGWMCTTEGVFSVPNCSCWELPGFVELMDVCEVNLLIAPRPVVFESAASDGCFPIRYTKEGFARIRAGYKIFGSADAVQQDIWPAGHEWHGAMAYPLVDKNLGGHAAGE